MMFNVSVVIPAFNEATRINRSIQSVLNQSLPVKEIIVVDDGSTDETAHVVANYYPAVTCIRQENQGLAGARNTGIKQARYEWIALLDADDEWTPNHIENAASILRQHEGIEWFFAAFDVRNPDGGLFHGSRLKEKYLRGDLVKDYFNAQAETGFSCSSSVLVKAEIFTQIGMFNMEIKHYGEDLDMWFRIASKHPQLAYCNSPGCNYWRREGSITSRVKNVDIPRFLRRIEITRLSSNPASEKIHQAGNRLIQAWLIEALKEAIKQKDRKHLALIRKQYQDLIPVIWNAIAWICTYPAALVLVHAGMTIRLRLKSK